MVEFAALAYLHTGNRLLSFTLNTPHRGNAGFRATADVRIFLRTRIVKGREETDSTESPMTATSRLTRRAIVATMTAVAVCSIGLPAYADDPEGAEAARLADIVADQSPDVDGDVEPVTQEGNVLTAGALTAAATADAGVVLDTATGFPLSIGLPAELSGATAVEANGQTIVYSGSEDTGLVAKATDTSVQLASAIENADAATAHTYTFDNTTGYLQEDGSVVLAVESEGISVDVAVIGTPWAVDADGAAVDTHFEVEGDTVTQIIETGPETAYPVVADPWIQADCGVITCTIRFDRATTSKIANKQNLIGIASAIGSAFAGPAAGITGAYLALFSSFAGNYYRNGNCFGLKLQPETGTRWAEQVRRNTYNCR